jgi:hypothetical protein
VLQGRVPVDLLHGTKGYEPSSRLCVAKLLTNPNKCKGKGEKMRFLPDKREFLGAKGLFSGGLMRSLVQKLIKKRNSHAAGCMGVG